MEPEDTALLGHGSVKTFPWQWLRTKQQINCWNRCFLYGPRRSYVHVNILGRGQHKFNRPRNRKDCRRPSRNLEPRMTLLAKASIKLSDRLELRQKIWSWPTWSPKPKKRLCWRSQQKFTWNWNRGPKPRTAFGEGHQQITFPSCPALPRIAVSHQWGQKQQPSNEWLLQLFAAVINCKSYILAKIL